MHLRRSTDEYVRGNVFINADLTRAEAEAAYHARCERRQQRQSQLTTSATVCIIGDIICRMRIVDKQS